MKEQLKTIGEWILIIVFMIALASWLTGCSANFHLKQSRKHLHKAISKGYEPLKDTTRTLQSIKPVRVNISTPNRTLIVNRIDTILKENNCLDTLILRQIVEVVDSVPYFLDLDTTLVSDNGAKVRLRFDSGMVYASWENLDVQDTVYIERMPLWGKVLLWFVVAFILLSIVRFLISRRP